MKYKYKIALLFTLICTLIMGVFSSLIYVLVIQHNQQQFKSRLEERAILASQVLLEKDELSSSQYNKIVEKQLRKLPNEIHYILRINEDGEVPIKNLPILLQVEHQIASLEEHLDIAYQTINNQEVAFLFYEDNEGSHIVVVTAQDMDGDEDLDFIKSVLVLLTALTFLIIGVISLWFARKILSPVKKIIQQVKKINSTTLDQRLTIKENHDQLYYLSQIFNELLERLEDSFENQKQFIHNASHELKTPLTILLAEAELGVKNETNKEEAKQTFQKIYFHAKKLKKLLDALIEISFIENETSITTETIRLDEVVQEAVNYIFKSNPNAKIDISYEDQSMSDTYLECLGNYDWVSIVLQNILSNALKYSSNKPVFIRIKDFLASVEVEILDSGIGISEKDITKIGNTFYRGRNAGLTEGSGVGLSLSYKIIKLLKGDLKINSDPPKGTKVVISLPK